MNILNIEHISKIYGDKVIFEDASFGIHEGDKIGIIGINGTGKTTLLRMAAGIEEPDSGQIVRQNGLRIAYLPQNPEFPRDATVSSYALGKSAETDWMVESNLTKLGIVQYDIPLAQLSGGQRRKVAMAKVLASEFDVLLLDEPTNHLDEEMIAWLEAYLREYRAGVGQAGLPRQKHQAESQTGTPGSLEKRKDPGAGSDCGDGFCGDKDGQKDH